MVLFFDSHPVQYKAPVYQRLQQLRPGSFKVVYATDASLRGHRDREFGQVVAWDQPLLDGYPNLVLNNERGTPLTGFRSLTGRGVRRLLLKERPEAVIISQFIYEFDLATYVSCLRLHIPIWIRQETQDEAFARPPWKQALRGLFYHLAYRQVRHAFYFGELNREHLLLHGFEAEQLTFAAFSTPVGTGLDIPTRQRLRSSKRDELGILPNEIVLLFSGKFIDKKNPHLIFDALERLVAMERDRLRIASQGHIGEENQDVILDSLERIAVGKLDQFRVVFAGSGPLENSLRARAEKFPGRVHFTGFVNQSEIPAWYLASDILVLPSRRAGETWGLVVNEALQAGCAVVMTKAVGCHPEFADWDRVRVIPDNDAEACALALRELAAYPRSLDWCADRIAAYSTEATAAAIARQLDTLDAAPAS